MRACDSTSTCGLAATQLLAPRQAGCSATGRGGGPDKGPSALAIESGPLLAVLARHIVAAAAWQPGVNDACNARGCMYVAVAAAPAADAAVVREA